MIRLIQSAKLNGSPCQSGLDVAVGVAERVSRHNQLCRGVLGAAMPMALQSARKARFATNGGAAKTRSLRQ